VPLPGHHGAMPQRLKARGLMQNAWMIELPKDARQQAIASIERYFRENMDEPIGNVAASGLLGFFLEEIGPVVYNKAVQDVQERLRMRIDEVDLEVHEDEFQYWKKFGKPPRSRQ
jgi:uncharacterized protein (DUF2164 family)